MDMQNTGQTNFPSIFVTDERSITKSKFRNKSASLSKGGTIIDKCANHKNKFEFSKFRKNSKFNVPQTEIINHKRLYSFNKKQTIDRMSSVSNKYIINIHENSDLISDVNDLET